MKARKIPLHGSDNPPALFRHGLLVLSLIGPGPAVLGAEAAEAFFKQYCVGCHGAKEPDADLSLLNLGPMDPQNAEVWHRVLNQMASGEMPPSQEKQPSDVERTAMTQRILGSMREAGVLGQALGAVALGWEPSGALLVVRRPIRPARLHTVKVLEAEPAPVQCIDGAAVGDSQATL